MLWTTNIKVCLLMLFSSIHKNILPRANCQLPNIYDLSWFESFSLQNYETFLRDHNTNFQPNKDENDVFSQGDSDINFQEDPTLSSKKFMKTTENNIESADASLENSVHFDSSYVQQSDR